MHVPGQLNPVKLDSAEVADPGLVTVDASVLYAVVVILFALGSSIQST